MPDLALMLIVGAASGAPKAGVCETPNAAAAAMATSQLLDPMMRIGLLHFLAGQSMVGAAPIRHVLVSSG